MRRNLFLVVGLLILSLTAQAQDMYRVKADKLKVRESNDPKGKVIGFILQNENVMVLDSTDAKFFKVKVKNAEGWVSSDYLEKIASSPAKPVQKPAVALPTTPKGKDNSAIILFAIVLLVSAGLLFCTYKYALQHKILVGLATVAVVAICYFCYLALIKAKTVAGVFSSETDTQYQSFNFKTQDSVEVKDTYADSTFNTKYVIEGDVIKLQQQENTIILMIRDEHTLIGEGFTKGVYSKN